MSELLSQLNEAQREAAACTEGPVMIIAGAGSGKTRTLTYRIAHLIEKGVDPFNILALTFTNKAAAEMKERIMRLVGNEARNLWMGTFHSIFARILRAEAAKLGYISSFTIYDTDDSKSAVKQIVKGLNLDPKVYNPGYVVSRISMAKSSLIGPEDYCENPEIQQTDQTARKPMIGEIYKLYNKRLRNAMAMDFDDLLFNTNILLRDFPEVLLKYQNRFRYILVDEYQDTNFAQYLIVKKLAARFQNICVVGDDAQSIYAFRGANIQNIFNFKRDYPSVKLFKLEQNYRSTKNIVGAANSIISNNKEQIQKEIWTDNGTGTPIILMRCSDERNEGTRVAESILETHLGDNRPFRDFAILYRINVQSRAIEEALRKNDIPYRVYAGISFYGRKEVKDALAYLRLVVNNYDDESLVRIINLPARGIGNTTVDRIRLAAADNDVSIWTVMENITSFGLGLNSGVIGKINDFMSMIKLNSAHIHDTDAYTLAKNVINSSGLITMLRNDDDPDNANRIENIEELLNGIQEFCEREDNITPGEVETETEGREMENFPSRRGVAEGRGVSNQEQEMSSEEINSPLKTLDQFLQQVLLLTSEDKDSDKEADKVSLMTIHAAKGLEFPYVFVIGMEENLFPSPLSINSREELEEERRLFYVAVTRAEIQLTLSYAMMRFQYGQTSYQELSRFVEEIDHRYLLMPRKQSSFPKPGTFQGRSTSQPSLFGRKASQVSEPPEKHRTTTVRSSSSPKTFGPVAPNTPEQIAAIQVGMTVAHAKFGTGKVLSVIGDGDSRKAVVFFDGIGEKQLLLKFAKLTIVEE
ncbi:MAG: UvrD-helicase domain-containing protein [Bacteroidales bacterium]|nr:UvrD-helicase domain-containing protein [Bacteroidales bacterium]